MARNPFGHIDLRVASMEDALPFYRRLLPALGFAHTHDSDEWKVFSAGGDLPSAAFVAITEGPDHRPNDNRIAFWVWSRDEVDRIAGILEEVDAEIESGPRECPEYSPSYYAVFFRDPSGNRLEIVHRTS